MPSFSSESLLFQPFRGKPYSDFFHHRLVLPVLELHKYWIIWFFLYQVFSITQWCHLVFSNNYLSRMMLNVCCWWSKQREGKSKSSQWDKMSKGCEVLTQQEDRICVWKWPSIPNTLTFTIPNPRICSCLLKGIKNVRTM